ncbi:hypothetical protein SAMN05444320_104346 [Streptoalloteichus hindustanus]|uniref:Uncharacterized protein n=1 Tax=Streptoalloteichus hindustanus TaxID=2017 RepID=A0A1M5D947_STRHI|nr:hypothetical protein SAMN05444320_104346 [Streptoalloteichus hindustanus]
MSCARERLRHAFAVWQQRSLVTWELDLSALAPPPAGLPEAARSRHATAVASSSTIRAGIASRVTPSIVVGGATRAAPNLDASTP